MDPVMTINDGIVDCVRLRTNDSVTMALHYHNGQLRHYITEVKGGVWCEIPTPRLYDLVTVGFDDGVLVNKIAALIEGRAV